MNFQARRREVLKLLAGAGLAAALPHSVWAATHGQASRRLIVVMLRGAVDGLSVVVPYTEKNYYALREKIAIPPPAREGGLIALDGQFGLHPALRSLSGLWESKKLAFVHASGSRNPTRSHFDAQDYLESGTPGVKSTQDGWMNRLLSGFKPSDSPLQAVNLGPVLPRILMGSRAVANVPLGRHLMATTAVDAEALGLQYDRLYANAGAMGSAYREGRQLRRLLLDELASDDVSPEAPAADRGAPSAKGFSSDARQLAQMIRKNPSLQLAFMQVGGWDTHNNQGGAEGQLAKRLRQLGDGLTVLADELGPEFERTVVVVLSEFGRTVRQNGSGGTDHGHGNVMWLLGGPIRGGKILGDWPGIDDKSLHEGRDLSVTTDFRQVLVAVCERHFALKDSQLSLVFPKAPTTTAALRGLFT